MPVKRGKRERQLVNVNKPTELRAWAKYFGCAQRDIRDAVATSGVAVEDVGDWIKLNVVRA
jgi:hypothetical protein